MNDKVVCIVCILIGLAVPTLSSNVFAQLDEGRLVFSIRKPIPSLDGFMAATGTLRQARGSELENWWQFYQYNICTVNPDGTDFRQLTTDSMSRRPRWSPDGKWIAYISGPENSHTLYIITKNGDEKTELLKRQFRIHDFWWSPNSQAILISVETKRAVDPTENRIVTIDGESRKRLRMSRWSMGWFHWDSRGEEVKEPKTKLIRALPKGVQWPEWSPDRRYIAVVTDGLLSLVEVETTSVTGQWFPQKNEPPCQKIEEWSPDGKQILFYVRGEVCAATVDGTQIRTIVNLSMGSGRNATWGPDGNRVAFVSRRGGGRNFEIYVVDIESGGTKRITYTNYDHFDLDWR